jgi:hypothetical protein
MLLNHFMGQTFVEYFPVLKHIFLSLVQVCKFYASLSWRFGLLKTVQNQFRTFLIVSFMMQLTTDKAYRWWKYCLPTLFSITGLFFLIASSQKIRTLSSQNLTYFGLYNWQNQLKAEF